MYYGDCGVQFGCQTFNLFQRNTLYKKFFNSESCPSLPVENNLMNGNKYINSWKQ